jgi:glycosyltransferase involved in cell wall biosynthesis
MITISALITAWNKEKYIKRAIDSVLSQTRPADEIIVVDDGSTDGTSEILRSYGSKIHCVYQPNQGVSSARNAGIKAAASEWIAFLDGDDEWLPDRLKFQCELPDRNSSLDWVSGNYINCRCDLDRREPAIPAAKLAAMLGEREHFESFFNALIARTIGFTGTMLIKKKLLLEAGLFEVSQNLMEDIDLWLRAASLSPRIGFVSEPVTVYHMDIPASLSRRRMPLDTILKLLDRQLDFAERHGKRQSFEPVMKTLIKSWLRASLFDDRIYQARHVLQRYGPMLEPEYVRRFRLLTLWPWLTMKTCRAISRMVRMLRIRRELIHPTE